MRARANRRAASGLLAGVAFAGVLGIVGAPAYGQSAGVGNSGQATAGSGNNSGVGNSSTNIGSNDTTQTTPSDTLVGGLLGLVLNLGNTSTNTSNGTSGITSGPATASGNVSDTGVAQTSAGTAPISTVFGPVLPAQSAGVSNSGGATANTGGNQSVGNDSVNTASNSQTVTGGLLAVGINISTASNTSNGTSTINTGPATASGNEAVTTVDQARIASDGIGKRFGVGGGAVCDGSFRFGGQRVEVENSGTASAQTGNNASVGNQSTNVASNTQTLSGGLLNIPLDLSLTGGATNLSDGTSGITTGAATASGNRSTTEVDQVCLQPVSVGVPTHQVASPLSRGVPVGQVHRPVNVTQQLAKTGVDPFVIVVIGFSLLFGGLLFMVWERVETLPARTPLR